MKIFFARYSNLSDYNQNLAWVIFSEAFTRSAQGDHAYVVVNDMIRGDFFERIELPIMHDKFTCITSLEPCFNDAGEFDFKSTTWSFDEWLKAQEKQWENPYHYLDGKPYPPEFC